MILLRELPSFRRSFALLPLPVLLTLSAATPALSQAGPESDEIAVVAGTRDDAPRVFIDCRRCDMQHMRREITFVNHVREADLADVHVLITNQQTGSGGQLFTLDFIGRQDFEGMTSSLPYASPQSNTDAQERDGLTQMLVLGLVKYAAQTPIASQLRLSFEGAAGAQSAPPLFDSWRNWTFEVYGGGSYNAETSQMSWSSRYGFYANRVTEEWKIRLRPYFNHNGRVIRREDREDIRISQIRHGFESHVIRSVGGHMGSGVFMDYITNTVDNMRHGFTLTPAVEYNLYPYSEASRRQITFTYRLGYEFADYLEETIYEKTEEALLSHSLGASVQFRQPWGSASSSIRGSRYLHDADHHRLTFNGNVQFRLGRGVSLNFGGSYQKINDQLGLPRGDASLEDILLQRRNIATSYRGSANMGLSYTFGSIFTNVVNPRL